MRRYQLCIGLAATLLLTFGALVPARALVVAPPPGAALAAKADAVIVGRVVAIADQDIEATPVKGADQKTKYRIAIVQVTDAVKGAKKDQTIQIGYPVMPEVGQPINGGGVRPLPIRNRYSIQLQVGMDGMFYLDKHHEGTFYVMNNPFGGFVSRENNENFDREVADVRLALKVLANPMASLKSKDRDERYITAALLLQQYRTPQGSGKMEPVDAEESKLILKAMLDADWDQKNWMGTRNQMSPMTMFYRLGVSENDGWQRPQFQPGDNPEEYQERVTESIKTWLKKNADTYRIQKYVKGPNGGAPGVGIGQPIPGGFAPANPGQPVQIVPPGGQIQLVPLPPGQGQVVPRGAQILPAPAGQAGAIQIQVRPAVPPVPPKHQNQEKPK